MSTHPRTRTTFPTSSAALAFGQSRFAQSVGSALRVADLWAPDLAARLAVALFFTPLPTKLSMRRRTPPAWKAEQRHTGREGFALLHYASAIQGPRRPRVLLVHGWAGNALQMRELGEAVAAAGFEPVLMDLPAHGRSAGWRCTMPQIVRSLFEAHACAGPFDAIVAHSMGAVASLHALAIGLPVRRLVALAPSSTPESVLRWFCETFRLKEGQRARMRELIETREMMALAQFEPQWLSGRVAAQVLLVHDRDDRMAPVGNSEALARVLPSARFHATQGLSHRRILQDSQVIDLALAHLKAAPDEAQAT